MSKRSEKLLLEDILDAIENILAYTDGLDFDTFHADRKTQDAVVRNFEIIGEAANKLPVDLIAAYPNVDWSGIIGFRHKLIHDYFGVDYFIVWSIIQTQLSPLQNQIKQVLKAIE